MTIQKLLSIDFLIIIPSVAVGIILSCLFGEGKIIIGFVGLSLGLSAICKVKNISKLVEGNVMEECMKSFAKYIYIPMQIVMSLIILGSLIYYSIF